MDIKGFKRRATAMPEAADLYYASEPNQNPLQCLLQSTFKKPREIPAEESLTRANLKSLSRSFSFSNPFTKDRLAKVKRIEKSLDVDQRDLINKKSTAAECLNDSFFDSSLLKEHDESFSMQSKVKIMNRAVPRRNVKIPSSLCVQMKKLYEQKKIEPTVIYPFHFLSKKSDDYASLPRKEISLPNDLNPIPENDLEIASPLVIDSEKTPLKGDVLPNRDIQEGKRAERADLQSFKPCLPVGDSKKKIHLNAMRSKTKSILKSPSPEKRSLGMPKKVTWKAEVRTPKIKLDLK